MCKNVASSKKGTESNVENLLLVCTFQYIERPIMRLEEVSQFNYENYKC